MKTYGTWRNTRWYERRRNALLNEIRRTKEFIGGSLVSISMTCGNKEHCKCGRGEKHTGWYIHFKVRGKTRSVYVPKDMLPAVESWCKEYRKLRKTIKEMSRTQRAIIRNYVKDKRRKHK